MAEDEAVEELERTVGERIANDAINAAGGAWVDDCLSLRDRSLVVVAARSPRRCGGRAARARRWALDRGVTPEELEATAALLAAYVGYLRASAAAETIREVPAEKVSRPES